jgi:Tol biopolymer transport system component
MSQEDPDNRLDLHHKIGQFSDSDDLVPYIVGLFAAALVVLFLSILIILRNRSDLIPTVDDVTDLVQVEGLEGRILYTANVRGDLNLLMALANGRIPSEIVVDTNASNGSWSNDGASILFQRNIKGTTNIFTADRDGGNQQPLSDVPEGKFARSPAWSPAQDRVYFESDVEGSTNIYQADNPPADPQMNGVRVMDDGISDNTAPAISPDGRFMAFSSNRDGDFDIYVQELNGDETVQITNEPGSDEFPAWSPDGRRIAFSSDRDGQFAIYVVNRDGSEQEEVFRTPDHSSWSRAPAWSPDGGSLIFVSDQDDSIGSFYGDIFLLDLESNALAQLTAGGKIWTWRLSWAQS